MLSEEGGLTCAITQSILWWGKRTFCLEIHMNLSLGCKSLYFSSDYPGIHWMLFIKIPTTLNLRDPGLVRFAILKAIKTGKQLGKQKQSMLIFFFLS